MFIKPLMLLASFCLLWGCQEDLMPESDADNRQREPFVVDDFTVNLNTEQDYSLSERLNNYDGIVLYFTMWCPVCDNHMQLLRSDFVAQYPNVDFVLVDYVSASAANSRTTQLNNGYRDFNVISDRDDYLENVLDGAMARVVLIDKNFTVVFSELFKNHLDLAAAIEGL